MIWYDTIYGKIEKWYTIHSTSWWVWVGFVIGCLQKLIDKEKVVKFSFLTLRHNCVGKRW